MYLVLHLLPSLSIDYFITGERRGKKQSSHSQLMCHRMHHALLDGYIQYVNKNRHRDSLRSEKKEKEKQGVCRIYT